MISSEDIYPLCIHDHHVVVYPTTISSTRVCTEADKRALLIVSMLPEHGVDAPCYSILNGDITQGLLDAPHIDVRVEGARCAML